MLTRLFPSPTEAHCTPYVQCAKTKVVGRLVNTSNGAKAVRLVASHEQTAVLVPVRGGPPLCSYRLPDRGAVIDYLGGHGDRCAPLLRYAHDFRVVPTFSLSLEEAIIKAVIRQLIRASQAKKLISDFIRHFGESDGLFYAFPPLSKLATVRTVEYRRLGLGMKAERISSIVAALLEDHLRPFWGLEGIGPWTEAVLRTDLSRDFRHYPFHDKSGERVAKLFGIQLRSFEEEHRLLAADLYVYAASYMECSK